MTMSTATSTKLIDVDTHFLPRMDAGASEDLFAALASGPDRRALTEELERLADPRAFGSRIRGRSPVEGASPHRDLACRVDAMGELGFDVQVLIPDGPYLNPYGWTPEGGGFPLEIRYELCKCFNNASAAAQGRYPEKFVGTAIVPFDDVETSCRELARSVQALGLRVAVIPANWLGRNLDAPELVPFWDVANELGVTLFVHHVPQGCGGAIIDHPPRYPMIGMERMRRLHVGTYMGFGMEYMMACAALTLGGVFDRFPKLRFCFFEAGGSWLPYAMYACDRAFLIEPQCSRTRALPSELILKHCMTAVEPMERIEELVSTVGTEVFFFGSDFPHPEFDTFHSTPAAILERERLSAEAKVNILGGNIARVLGIPQ